MNFDNMSEADFMDDRADYIAYEIEPFHGNYKETKTYDGVKLFKCTRCGQYKERSQYYEDNRVPCGVRSKCKSCHHKR